MTKEAREHNEFVKVDFAHANPKHQYFKDGLLVKKWNVKKKDTVNMICSIIEAQEPNKFKATRLKAATILAIEKLNPKTIKIVKRN